MQSPLSPKESITKFPEFDDQSGSAITEFVLLALPLFLPALIFFISITQVSRAEMDASILAREAAHAFVTSENDAEGHLRTRLLLNAYRNNSSMSSPANDNSEAGHSTNNSYSGNSYSGNSSSGNSSITSNPAYEYSIRCSSSPCIMPGSEIELTLYIPIILDAETTSIESAPGNHWAASRDQVQNRRMAVASARGYVDKWR